jgi:hypothetical protein
MTSGMKKNRKLNPSGFALYNKNLVSLLTRMLHKYKEEYCQYKIHHQIEGYGLSTLKT